jgi:large repetitive protein
MRRELGRSGAVVAGMVLVLAACTQQISQQTASPEASSSAPFVDTTPSTVPTPAEAPPPATVPSPATSPSHAKLIITSVPFHMGEVGLAYGTVTSGAAGGVKPYKWSISSGALPPGLTLSSGGNTTGKPTAAGTYSFVIRVDDSAGAAAGVSRSVFVFRQIAFTTTNSTCTGLWSAGCTIKLNYNGGASSAPKLKVTLDPQSPPLPTGSTFTAKGGVVTVSIAPTQCNSYDGLVTLVLLDQSPCTVGYNCSSGPASVVIRLTSAC